MATVTNAKLKGGLSKRKRGKANDGMPKTRRATHPQARASDRMPRRTRGAKGY